MKSKTIKIIYWVLTVLFCLSAAADAGGGLAKAQAGIDGMQHLGYPLYLMTFLSILKLLGVVALLQTRFRLIKEWTFAGFAFVFIGAAFSKAAVGDNVGILIVPLIMLMILFIVYFFWRIVEQAKTA
jgi:hypothetical protein